MSGIGEVRMEEARKDRFQRAERRAVGEAAGREDAGQPPLQDDAREQIARGECA